ncbi:ataxin-7 isoform X2 [Austrofundulus limnaeus]|uniref:Ataxin-7 isoform X2 n=1 Tax=Austrofundulus limnaeus TaxID=52670 RepID=A0A2I4BC46_AUSLI|nr:PREDICTED: ataxin-7 isoform X2 [Austrofundulus limnaeus]
MSERAEDDVRGEQRRAARQQLKQQQIQRGEGSTAMATVSERRSLPSPEIMLGQPWSSWVDAAKLHVHDGAESEESFKDLGKNREAMRLCREDMPIFGQCPAQDDFYLVMCSHCGLVVKPQAFQAHYERRHSSTSKPASTSPFSVPSRNRSTGSGLGSALGSGTVAGVTSGGILNRLSSAGSSLSSSSSSSNTKFSKSAKEKLQGIQRRPPPASFREAQPDKIPAVKMEKMHLKVDSAKLVQTPSAPVTTSSYSSNTTVSFNTAPIATSSSSLSSSALKPGLNCSSIPKPPLPAPGQIPYGKILLADKKQDSSSSASSRRHCNKKVSEREFNPDIHCGVMVAAAQKPCTRSLTCKTHSISHRRAVPGRRKRFDILLKELKDRSNFQQNAPLRDPPPNPQPAPVNRPDIETPKPSPLGKPKFHSPGLPRVNSSPAGGSSGDPAVVHESPHHPQTTHDGLSRPSSDEGENEEREDNAEKLDCLYSGYHPRPAAYCTFGSRLFGRGFYSFDRRWNRVRCTLTTMMEKHVNSQMWKKIPLALENSFSVAPTHRTSTNSHGSTPSSGFLGPPATLPQTPYEGKSALSYGTTLNAHSSLQGGAEHPAYGTTQARQVSSSPQMPSAHLSSSSSSSLVPSLASGRTLKSRSSSSSSTTKSSSSFRPKETSSGSSTPVTPNSASGGGAGANSSTTSFSSGKKRKNSSILSSSHASSESSSSNANFSSSSSSSFKKNCANVGSSGSTYHHSSFGLSSSSSLSFSHSGVHSVGLNCGPNVRTNSLSLKAEPSGGSAVGSSGPPARGPPSGSPAESIKRMSVMMNSSDSTLSLGPFVHHQSSSSSDHHASFSHHSSDGRLEGKKRKSSSASSGINSVGGGGGLGGGAGGTGPGRPKVAKSPAMNNIHGKHGRSLPGTPGLPNNSHLHQPKARP